MCIYGGLGEKSPKLIISREAEDDSTEQRLKWWADTHDDESSGSNEAVNEKYCQPNETTCCLHPLHMTLDLIILLNQNHLKLTTVLVTAKMTFHLQLCLNFINASHLITQLHQFGHAVFHIASIDHYLPVLVLYEGHLVIFSFQGVTVTSCGCA